MTGRVKSILLCRYIQNTSVHSGCGLYEGLDWLSNNIPNMAESFSYNHIPHPFSHRNHQNKVDLTLIEMEKDIVVLWKSGMNFFEVAILKDTALLFLWQMHLHSIIHICAFPSWNFVLDCYISSTALSINDTVNGLRKEAGFWQNIHSMTAL